MRKLSLNEISRLETQGCSANDWQSVNVAERIDLAKIRNVRFLGNVSIHEGVSLHNIPGGISGCIVRENARIENVASIEFEEDSSNGVGSEVSVLDETGSRSVRIYPGLSSQIATLMARDVKWKQQVSLSLENIINSRITPVHIGENALVRNCGPIKNVSISHDVIIDGASRLENGSVINNASPGKCFAYIGNGVEAENFILEDGRIESKSIVINCYVGQGTVISHAFTAHDSLFFANCAFENGEAHSLLAGPYTVSMHKGTLLIACQTSFMNAGSATNQSNHMYKMGPIHWGVLERGVKTSSGSYLMLGARIGAFSLLMGAHKNHPDSSEFPFSYLFSEERGGSIIVPAMMLRSCGLMRDESKWPVRDKRKKLGAPFFDRITFSVLNPFTVDLMLKAIDNIDNILKKPAGDDMMMRYKGLKFTRASMERAKTLYTLAIFKYLDRVLGDKGFPQKEELTPDNWVDLGGQILPRSVIQKARESSDISEVEIYFTEAMENYKELEINWISRRFGEWWRSQSDHIHSNALKYDEIIEEDKRNYLDMLSQEETMLSL